MGSPARDKRFATAAFLLSTSPGDIHGASEESFLAAPRRVSSFSSMNRDACLTPVRGENSRRVGAKPSGERSPVFRSAPRDKPPSPAKTPSPAPNAKAVSISRRFATAAAPAWAVSSSRAAPATPPPTVCASAVGSAAGGGIAAASACAAAVAGATLPITLPPAITVFGEADLFPTLFVSSLNAKASSQGTDAAAACAAAPSRAPDPSTESSHECGDRTVFCRAFCVVVLKETSRLSLVCFSTGSSIAMGI
mmetsp:Transcript_12728/g.42269  ORF Transcript_12728/g.42269 Transcript_12728/m.42269 type:complete len:251 (+) Transcript_12728:1388-2140(+)